MMHHQMVATDLLQWRRQLLERGGRPSELDWLLDLEGGVSWQQQQQLRLNPERAVALAVSLSRLEELWEQHLHQHTRTPAPTSVAWRSPSPRSGADRGRSRIT